MLKKKRIKLNKEKRSNVFRLRLTQLERERWEAMAEEVGLANNLSNRTYATVTRDRQPSLDSEHGGKRSVADREGFRV
jgi:hypothetical protein